ncbi:MAG TPA: YicC/YloC family endoribonuclease [Dongiaceae bacterium]|nr:YicC/YloC family endoribonuclease [Dongiaceae bacterium]
MTIRSMTGFARTDGVTGPIAWHWEVRSVNGRGLDMRLRLPPGSEALEPRIRVAVGKRITRGNVTINLNIKRSQGETRITLNTAAVHQVLAAIETLKTTMDFAPPRPEALLGIKGVLEVVEPEESEAEMQVRTGAMLAGLNEALDGMVRAREAEGRHLETIVRDQLAGIERLVATIAASPARAPEAIRLRLKEQVGRLLETGANLDEGRLYQEAAMLATRADVEEELKRLGAHIAGTRELLSSREPAGRRLDFLAQEFNREANTVCSKSNDPETTRAGLELKAIIDQMREQVQNIE